jgi:glycosyltransferase involved in cell wall biosynthesis
MKLSIDILLSTYNGEAYLREQMESFLGQSHRNFILTIRDDGSGDSTPAILSQYAHIDDRIKLVLQENIGVVSSFHWLLKNADSGCQYFAFADQDDVWLPNKLEKAMNVLAEYDQELPLLYCSRLEYVSADLRHLGYSPLISKQAGFGNALVQNIATGCTIVMNKTAREWLLKHEWPPQVLLHDWWCYLVVSAFGKVICDDFVSTKYRQHRGNLVGGTVSVISDFEKRIVNFQRRHGKSFFGCYDQAYGFWVTYREYLKGINGEILRQFIDSKQSFLHRIRYLTYKNIVYRQTLMDDTLLRLLIMINKY